MLMIKLSAFTAVAASKFRHAQETHGMNIPKEVHGDELQEWKRYPSP
jgi:hypothetical protein